MAHKLADLDVRFIHAPGVFLSGKCEVDFLGGLIDLFVEPIGTSKGLLFKAFLLRPECKRRQGAQNEDGDKNTNDEPPVSENTVLRLWVKSENKVRLVFWIFITFAGSLAWAHKPNGGDIRATASMFRLQTHQYQDSFSSPWKSGLGLVTEGDVDDNGGLEISIFYMEKLFAVHRGGMSVVEESKRMYIAMGYRHWFNEKISAALAFFSSYQMGDGKTIRSDFPFGLAPKTSARDVTEYGFEASVQYEPWSAGNLAAVIDGRYSYSVTAKPGEDGNHYMVLVGLKYFVQSREPSEEEDLE